MAAHVSQCATIDFQSLTITGPSRLQQAAENVHKAEAACDVCVCWVGGVSVML